MGKDSSLVNMCHMGAETEREKMCVMRVSISPDAWPLGSRVKRRRSAAAASLWARTEEVEEEEEDGALV